MAEPPTPPTGHIVPVTHGSLTFLLETAWTWPVIGIVLGLAWFAFRLLAKRKASLK